jgi:hypothetical protein
MTPEGHAANALRRLVGVGLALGAVALVHRYVRVDRRRDPVGAVRAVVTRYPPLRSEVPVDRLGPACDGGDAEACTELGIAFASARASIAELPLPQCVEQALYARACDGGHWRGCALLVPGADGCGAPDLERVDAVLDRACERLVFAACDARAQMRGAR